MTPPSSGPTEHEPSRARPWRVVLAFLLAAVPLAGLVTAGTGPAAGAPVDVPAINQGFTILTFGDVTLGNSELEGSVAAGGDLYFSRGYPIVHSTGLTPTDYELPVIDGDRTRLLVGGRFQVDGSSGVSELTSAGRTDDSTQLGFAKIEDTSNLAINGRGGGQPGHLAQPLGHDIRYGTSAAHP